MVILAGALLADSPHTRPVPVSVSGSSPQLLRGVGSEPSDYKGSSGIVGVLAHSCAAADIPTISLWASVPHYVAQAPSPKVTLALLRTVEDVLDFSLPQGELPEEARAWERGVDELAQQDSDVADYVRTLEEAKDATDLPEASGDAIAREFERYLRRRGNRGDASELLVSRGATPAGLPARLLLLSGRTGRPGPVDCAIDRVASFRRGARGWRASPRGGTGAPGA